MNSVKPTFEAINKLFLERLPDPSLAEGVYFNYYKIFQHAASYEAMNDTSKLIKNTLADRSLTELRLRYAARNIVRRRLPFKTPKRVVVLDDKRTINTPEGAKSYYFGRISGLLNIDETSYITDHHKASALPIETNHTAINALAKAPLDAVDLNVLRDIKGVLQKARAIYSGQPLFYAYLSSCFTVFFEAFHRFNHYFKFGHAEILLLTTHYHHEGLIAAAKLHGVRVCEFQHGLISRKDLYYVYPPMVRSIAARCMFADRIVVFGEYWKHMLLEGSEFTSEQIFVAGDYSLRETGMMRYKSAAKENAILIGTQKSSAALYVEYIQKLLPVLDHHHPDWKIWVKLHPLERQPEAYEPLMKHPRCTIFQQNAELMDLLCRCRIQVSIYSTTLYDALGLGVVNFSLQNYGRSVDYAADMLNERIALPLNVEDDPVACFEQAGDIGMIDANAVYAPFNEQLLLSALQFEDPSR